MDEMTEMTGTEKQIAWAKDIRAKFLGAMAERLAAAKAKGNDPTKIAAVEAKVARAAGIAAARWWIDLANNGQLGWGEVLDRVDYEWRDDDGAGYKWCPPIVR